MKKRALIPVFAAFMALTLNVSHPFANTYKKAEITATILNVRSENNTSSNIISKLSEGDQVPIVEIKDGWYKIKLDNGNEGWISSEYTQEKQTIGVVNGNNVNLREGNSLESPVIGTLNTGNEVEILDKTSDWYKVKVNEQVGYIYNSFINIKQENKAVSRGDNRISKVYEVASSKLGKKYVWAASGPDTFDCSGFTMYVYKTALGVDLPHSSRSQSSVGTSVSKDELKLGDLVFFDTSRDGKINHVGIYIGDGNFIHASSAKAKVMTSNLNEGYYLKTYKCARRVSE
ncbi:C40 family peptidase [Tepidibacter formicigenes]|uniref:SH3 domain-containing protein n=1 Tax=Tepidibacter formicigenes DSM 15518 TaxID=1123349 RepID=A0A1M6K2I8_9FIRM|nr:C40 family peptidase [Tepidibacter formicigenes]SHJ53163.1 SH3 domain-containing protein [Tepidibacter formicigenes DSM 15518]